MTNRTLDVIALGTCYVDTSVENFPFNRDNLVGEEFIGERYTTEPGGSAVNFCRLGSTLGLRTAFIGMAGSDSNGDTLAKLLEQQGVHAALIRRPDLLTNIGFNIANPRGDHIMFVAGTANAALDPAAAILKLKELLPSASMLYLGGCLKQKAFVHAFEEVADLTNQHAAALMVDHGRIPEGVSKAMLEAVKQLVTRATYYFPSREEFCSLWEVATIEDGLDKLQAQAPNLTVVVKDGANGAFYWADGAIRHVTAEKVEKIFNPTGAGDSFNTGVISALLKKRPLADAITYGCKVAAAKITAAALPVLD